jgi:serine/threonine protein kinase
MWAIFKEKRTENTHFTAAWVRYRNWCIKYYHYYHEGGIWYVSQWLPTFSLRKLFEFHVSRNSLVSKVCSCGLDMFLFATVHQQLCLTQLPVQWVLIVLSPGIKWQEHCVNTDPHLVQRLRIHMSSTSSPHHGLVFAYRDNFTFITNSSPSYMQTLVSSTGSHLKF